MQHTEHCLCALLIRPLICMEDYIMFIILHCCSVTMHDEQKARPCIIIIHLYLQRRSTLPAAGLGHCVLTAGREWRGCLHVRRAHSDCMKSTSLYLSISLVCMCEPRPAQCVYSSDASKDRCVRPSSPSKRLRALFSAALIFCARTYICSSVSESCC